MGELTPKQRLFVEEYLKDLNATKAAIRARYSEKTAHSAGPRMLENVDVMAAIKAAMDKRSERTAITQDYVLNKIVETIERCSQAEPVMEFDKDTKEMVATGEWKFEYPGVLKGCELLGKHLKLFTDRVEHSGKVGWLEILNKQIADEESK